MIAKDLNSSVLQTIFINKNKTNKQTKKKKKKKKKKNI